MNRLNHFGRIRLDYLRTCRPRLLQRLIRENSLQAHLLASQRNVEWELGQLTAAGMDAETAESYLLGEILHNPEPF